MTGLEQLIAGLSIGATTIGLGALSSYHYGKRIYSIDKSKPVSDKISRFEKVEISKALNMLSVTSDSEIDLLGRDLKLLSTHDSSFMDAIFNWLYETKVKRITYYVLGGHISYDLESIAPEMRDKYSKVTKDNRFSIRKINWNPDTSELIKYLWERHFIKITEPNQLWLAANHPNPGQSHGTVSEDILLINEAQKDYRFSVVKGLKEVFDENSIMIPRCL